MRDMQTTEGRQTMNDFHSQDPTAQDVIDALRLALMSQDDPVEIEKVARCLVDLAPETESNGGIDLLRHLISTLDLKVAVRT